MTCTYAYPLANYLNVSLPFETHSCLLVEHRAMQLRKLPYTEYVQFSGNLCNAESALPCNEYNGIDFRRGTLFALSKNKRNGVWLILGISYLYCRTLAEFIDSRLENKVNSGVGLPYRHARLHRMNTIPAYVDWRTCTVTPLSRVHLRNGSSKALTVPCTVYNGIKF